MKTKILATVLAGVLAASCAPATIASPSETPTSVLTFTSAPPTETQASLASANVTPTTEPSGSLSAAGPWLLYVHNSPSPGMPGSSPVPPEFILLNPDGTGRTPVSLPDSHDELNTFFMDGDHSANYLAKYGDQLYLLRPAEATGILIDPAYNTSYNGDEKGGLLSSFYQSAEDAAPELIIFELPGGTIRDRFPLVRCGENADVCERFRSNWSLMTAQFPRWSPNGRYLAFAAILDAATSDLFVYDSQDGSLRRLTSGPDWVGPIEWSPDGTRIIMQELLNDDEFFFDPSSKPPTSVWSVSVRDNEIKLLYPTKGAYTQQTIMQWLDDHRFLAYEGFLVNADQARNLRIVDLQAGTNRVLFESIFGSASFDPIHETVSIYALNTESLQQGTYLISARNSTVRRLEGSETRSFPRWDEDSGLFVGGEACTNDPDGFQAFDYQGNETCVRAPTPTSAPPEPARYPSPDGRSSLFMQGGLWLETEGKPAAPLTPPPVSDVIWCPDSTCIFFSAPQAERQWTLYRVSLPDLTIETVETGIESSGGYQWLGGDQ